MYNNYPSDGSKKICTVTAVDLTRAVCKCVSDLGEILSDVRWLVPTGGTDGSGSSYHPVENTKVLVDISTGFPFILGAILSESTNAVRRPNVGRQDIDEPQIADYTTITTGDLIRGPGTPRDQRVGDILNTSDGGAIQGVLASGTVINKASPLAQMVLSRYGDLARLVSRNFEHFTEVDKTQKTSIRGSLYSRREIYRNPSAARNETPNVVIYEGNVQMAEAIEAIAAEGYDETDSEGVVTHRKYSYASIPADAFPAALEDDFIVEKIYVYEDTIPAEGEPRVPTEVFTKDIYGKIVHKVQTIDELNHVVTEKDNLSVKIQYTTDSSESTHYQDATTFHMDITDTVSVDGSAAGIVIHSGNEDDSILTEIRVNADGTLQVTTTGDADMDIGGNLAVSVVGDTDMSVGGNFTVDVSGTSNWTSAGAYTLTAPVINFNN